MSSALRIRTVGWMTAVIFAGMAPDALAATKIFTASETITAANTQWEGYDIVIRGATVAIDGQHTFASVTVEHNGANVGVLTHTANTVNNGVQGMWLTVTGNMTIEGAGAGFGASKLSVDAKGYPGGLGDGAGQPAATASGGSHGGAGGWSTMVAPTGTYGDFQFPGMYGSGGGKDSDANVTGGAGGGAVRLDVAGVLLVDGTISANGASYNGWQDGAGAGGSIRLSCGTVSGAGSIGADGGSASTSYSGAGGGGRVSVETDNLVMPSTKIHCYGGTGYESAGAGTVWIDAPSFAHPTLIIDNGGVASGGITEIRDNLTIPGSLLVRNEGRIGPPRQHPNLHLTVANDIQVLATGRITANGRGYASGTGPGAGISAAQASGGSHGGAGGFSTLVFGADTYGDFHFADTMGSGGGADSDAGVPGGTGGGVLRITSMGPVTVDGLICANGNSYNGWQDGAGAGGSVNLDCPSLSGAGAITADGGSASTSYGGAGGGGRVVVSTGNLQMPDSKIHCYGGTGYGSGGAGTVWLSAPAFPFPTLVIDNGGVASNGITEMRDTVSIDGNLKVRNQGRIGPPRLHPNLHLVVAHDTDVEATGQITAEGRGFPSATGPGAGGSGNTAGGGGHGGKGGNGTIGLGGAKYGSIPMPSTMGSGGGKDVDANVSGARGGGVIRLTVNGQLKVNGLINANGASYNGWQDGGGAGGAIYVLCGSLTGSGAIINDGGSASTSYSGGGGGGLTAVYTCNSTFSPSQIHAVGGIGWKVGDPGVAAIYSASVNISDQPDDLSAAQGAVAFFSVQATGSGPVTYKWRFNGTPLQASTKYIGVNQPSLAITNLNCTTDQGVYDVVITDSCGNAISRAATLTIAPVGDLNNDCVVGAADVALPVLKLGEASLEVAQSAVGVGLDPLELLKLAAHLLPFRSPCQQSLASFDRCLDSGHQFAAVHVELRQKGEGAMGLHACRPPRLVQGWGLEKCQRELAAWTLDRTDDWQECPNDFLRSSPLARPVSERATRHELHLDQYLFDPLIDSRNPQSMYLHDVWVGRAHEESCFSRHRVDMPGIRGPACRDPLDGRIAREMLIPCAKDGAVRSPSNRIHRDRESVTLERGKGPRGKQRPSRFYC